MSEILDSDSAREYLVENLIPKFSDATFAYYVRNEIAGDFAFQLAKYLHAQHSQPSCEPVGVFYVDEYKRHVQFTNPICFSDGFPLYAVPPNYENLRNQLATANARIAELEARCPVSCAKRGGTPP